MASDKELAGAGNGVKHPSASEGQCTSFAAQDGDAQVQMFRSLADHSQEFIGMCDLEFKPFYVNEAGLKMLGLGSLEEACSVRVQDCFFPEDRQYITEEFFPKVLRDGAGEVEIRFRHFKTGAALWMIYNVFQLRDAQGMVSGYATVSRDITERKETERAVQSVALFPEQNPFPVLRVDADGRLLFANRASAYLLEHWSVRVGEAIPAAVQGEVAKSLDAGVMQEHEFAVGERRLSFVVVPIADRRYVNLYGRDVTEQRRTQEELRQSEERFRVAQELSPDGFTILRPVRNEHRRVVDFTWVYQNAAAAQFTGVELENLVGRRLLELFPGHRETDFFKAYAAVAETGERRVFEAHYGKETVAPRWFRIAVVPVGRDIAVLAQDITARKRAEEALRGSEERYRRLFDSMTEGFALHEIITDEEGRPMDYRFLDVNPAFERLTGLNRAELLGKCVREVLPGVESFWIENYGRVALTGEPVHFENYAQALGRWYGVFAYRSVPRQFAVVFTDITARKLAEEALRESEERLRAVLRATGVGLWLNKVPLGQLTWDARTRELYFVGPGEEATVDLYWNRLHPEDREPTRLAVEEALRDRALFSVDHRAVEPGTGRVRWIHSEGRGIYNASGELVRFDGVNYDITELKAFQAELQRLVDERTARLQELVGELEHFSYTITHDLKSPLRAMRGFAEMMSLTCGECDTTRAKEFLGRISTSAERMDRLIADALNFSRSVRQELPLEDVDAGALLRGMLDSYPELQPDKARIRVEGRLPVVLANEAGLTQCFSNLLGNAVKFAKRGEKPEVRVWASRREGWVRIWVEDKGIGIAKEMLPRVFDMFARGSRDYEGTGIGLALVRKVTQRMGGRVGVESEEGNGSRFWIELKCGEGVAFAEAKAPVEARGGGGGTVLYVEDEESDAIFMERAFAAKGLSEKLRLVADGRAAINYLSGAGKFSDREKYPVPSVVLLDLNLPHVPGFEVLEWMRNHPDFARTPVVVFSSSTREDDRLKARVLGANDFVPKPNSGLMFGAVVEEVRAKWLGPGGEVRRATVARGGQS